jgi:hypothetical protein
MAPSPERILCLTYTKAAARRWRAAVRAARPMGDGGRCELAQRIAEIGAPPRDAEGLRKRGACLRWRSKRRAASRSRPSTRSANICLRAFHSKRVCRRRSACSTIRPRANCATRRARASSSGPAPATTYARERGRPSRHACQRIAVAADSRRRAGRRPAQIRAVSVVAAESDNAMASQSSRAWRRRTTHAKA